MITTIEKYRGFEIKFDSLKNEFSCIVSENNGKESKSFPAIKRFIDEYKKDNQGFEPFLVEYHPNYSLKPKIFKITGIRKDGGIIGEVEGKAIRLSKYDLDDYILFSEGNKQDLNLLTKLYNAFDKYTKEVRVKKKAIIDSMAITTLKDYMKTLNNQ